MFSKFVKHIQVLFIYFFISILVISCSDREKKSNYAVIEKGIQHQLISFEENQEKLKMGDYIFLNAIFTTTRDSIFWTSKLTQDKGFYYQLSDSLMKFDFFNLLFTNYSAGDSIHFRMKKESFFHDIFNTEEQNILKNNDSIVLKIKIERSVSPDNFNVFLNEVQFKQEARKYQQKEIIREWVKKNMTQPVEVDSLLFYEKTRCTNGKKITEGSVFIIYEGFFLDGTRFEQILPTDSFIINYGKESQLDRKSTRLNSSH